MTDHLQSLFDVLEQSERRLPPVQRWNPKEEKDIGMRIAADGTWYHQGSPIHRERMVRLFSTVLRRDGDNYFLVTPIEKVRVQVEVAPLLAIRMDVRQLAEQEIAFETNVGDVVVADREHPITVRGEPDHPIPVVVVRHGIEALIVRSVFYELVEMGVVFENPGGPLLRVSSKGCWFELGPTE